MKNPGDKGFSLRRLCEGVLQGLKYAGMGESEKISHTIPPGLEVLLYGPSTELTNLLNLLYTWVLTDQSISGAQVEWISTPSDQGPMRLAARVRVVPVSGIDGNLCPGEFLTFPSALGIVDRLGGTMVVRDGGFLDITFPLTEPAPATHAPIEMERMLEDFPDPALCRCLIEEFFAQTQKLLEDLPEHLNSRDFSTVHRIAHTIKGGALNIHAPEISQTAKEFEHDAKARRLEKGLFYREKLLHELSAAVKYFKVTSQKEHRYEQ